MSGQNKEIRILCVDDEPGVLMMYKAIFGEQNALMGNDVRDRLLAPCQR